MQCVVIRELRQALGPGPLTPAHSDLDSEDSIVAFFAAAVAKFGRIDYACNIAGVLVYGASTEFSSADFDRQWRINTRGTWLCQRAELIQMTKQPPLKGKYDLYPQRGSIVNMSSAAGKRGFETLPSYCATKHAILGFTKSDALRVATQGIRINAVCPGVIDTTLLGDIDLRNQTQMAHLVSDMYMRRLGHPEEVAEAVLFLTSGKASFITATTISVDGGTFRLQLTTCTFLTFVGMVTS
jgi:NAD(P)-dependent dehydrogenase (short-subunit alcohol dehydrogenase family)